MIRSAFVILRYALLCAVFVLIGFVWSREIPRLKILILRQVQTLSRKEASLEVTAKEIEFRIIPLGIQLNHITIKPQSSQSPLIIPVQVDAIGVFLDISALLAGRFEVDKISIEHPVAVISVKKDEGNGTKKRQVENWNDLINAPIRSIIINHADLKFSSEPLNLNLNSQSLSFSLEKNDAAARLELFAPELSLSHADAPQKIIKLGLMTRIIAEQNALELAALKIVIGHNYIIARGVGRGDTMRFEFPFINGRFIYDASLSETLEVLNTFDATLSLPKLSGHSRIEVTAKAERGKEPELSVHGTGQEITLTKSDGDKFTLGNFDGTAVYDKAGIRSKSLLISNTSGKARIENINIQSGTEHKISAKVNIEAVELRELLQNLSIQNTPVHMDISGGVPCEGTLNPLLIKCAGELEGKDFRIHTDSNKTVVALDHFVATSELAIDKQKVTFPKALLKIGNTTVGTVNGSVNFKEGFQFNYHSDRLDFADVKNLADLKFLGGMAVTGTTQGNGHGGIIDVDASANQFWFEDYGLGTASLHLNYEKGELKLTKIAGVAGALTYNGDALIRVSDEGGKIPGLEIAHLNIPKLDLSDLQQKLFGKKVTLPFETEGTGEATLTASGPFSLSQLTYTLKSSATKVKVLNEFFDELKFNVHGDVGHAYADEVYMKKGRGNLVWTGDVLPSGIMNVNIHGSDLRLGEMDHIQELSTTFDGHLDLNAKLRKFILAPQVDIHGDLTNLSLNQQSLEDSQFDLGLNPMGLKLDGNLFNNKVTGTIDYPFKPNQPFDISFIAVDWDFSPLLNFFAKSPRRDYDTNLTAKVSLEGKDGNIWKSSGIAELDHIYIRHGNSQLRNTEPLKAQFDNGQVTINETEIRGENTQLTFSGNKNRHDAINVNVNGRIDLSLLTFLTPFLRDMSGELSLSTQIAGTLEKPDILGTAFIKDGYFKLDALPQPFEAIHTDLLFSQKRILINKMTGHYGGGNLSANGNISFESLGDVPVNINGELTNASLTLPEGFKSHGDFHFDLTGSWFPYLMKGDYVIHDGLYTKSFSSDNGDSLIKRSIYLPKVVLQKDFVPLEVDINTHFQNGIIIKNSLIDAELKGELGIKGDPSHPMLKGDVLATPGGKIFFRETPFTISETRVNFNSPNEINPTLYTLATSRVRDWDVTLLITGTMQKYQIQLSSNPPLSNKNIVSLLALGVTEDDENKTQQALITPNSLTNANSQGQSQVQGYEAGSLLLSDNPLNNELKSRFGINMRLSQTVDDLHNIIIPHIVAEKSWSPRVSTSVSRSVGDYITQNAAVEYKLDRHFSVLGSFEQRDYDLYALPGISGTQPTNQRQILGLDLQYQMQFK